MGWISFFEMYKIRNRIMYDIIEFICSVIFYLIFIILIDIKVVFIDSVS